MGTQFKLEPCCKSSSKNNCMSSSSSIILGSQIGLKNETFWIPLSSSSTFMRFLREVVHKLESVIMTFLFLKALVQSCLIGNKSPLSFRKRNCSDLSNTVFFSGYNK